MGILDRLRRWVDGEAHADVDVERTSAEVVGRLNATTDRLCRALDELQGEIEEREAEGPE